MQLIDSYLETKRIHQKVCSPPVSRWKETHSDYFVISHRGPMSLFSGSLPTVAVQETKRPTGWPGTAAPLSSTTTKSHTGRPKLSLRVKSGAAQKSWKTTTQKTPCWNSHGNWTLPSALPPAPPWAVAHTELPVQHRPTYPWAYPTVLPTIPGPQDSAVATRDHNRWEALGNHTRLDADNRLHLQHQPGDLRQKAGERRRRRRKIKKKISRGSFELKSFIVALTRLRI